MFNRLTDVAEARHRTQVLIDKYNNFERSVNPAYPEYKDVNTLVVMLNSDDELAELVTMSKMDEICELSAGSKNRCRTSLHFNREFRLYEKFWSRFQDGDMIMRVFDKKDYSAQSEKYISQDYSAILHCDWFSRNRKEVPQKFLNVIIDFLVKTRNRITQNLLLNRDQSDQDHKHTFQQVHPVSFPRERFGPSFSPITESRENTEKRVLESFGKAGDAALAATRISLAKGITFEYATYKDFYECNCGAEHYQENVGLI